MPPFVVWCSSATDLLAGAREGADLAAGSGPHLQGGRTVTPDEPPRLIGWNCCFSSLRA
jgi:hypothetical protein